MTEEKPSEELLEELRRRERESESAIPPPSSDGEAPQEELIYNFGPGGKLFSPMGNPAPEGYRKPVTTAFLVVMQEDGQIFATGDINILGVMALQRPAGNQDMIPACSQVIADIQMLATVQNTVQTVMQTTAQMAEDQRRQAMASKLAQKGIHLPPRW